VCKIPEFEREVRQCTLSSRSVSPDAVGQCLCSPFPPGFPAVPHHLNHTSVVADPSQNRACAIYAHGSSHSQFTENPNIRPSPLCGTVSLSPVPRFWERLVFPHPALTCVASFPPAALPAFTGTIRRSDSLCLICLPPSSVVRHTLFAPRETQGLPGCRVITMSNMPWSQTPRKQTFLAICENACVDFHFLNSVVLPYASLTGLNPFSLSVYPYISCRWPLSEPCLRYLRTRLLT